MTARQWTLKEPAAIFFIGSLLNHGHYTMVVILLSSKLDICGGVGDEPIVASRRSSRPWQKGFVHTAAGEIKIMIRTACEDSGIGTDAHSCSARTRIAIQNRNRIARASADSPCRPRGVPLPSNCRITSARLKPPR